MMNEMRDLKDLSEEGKLYYSISEVAVILGENSSLIRFWEKQFPGIKPKRNAKGNRIYTREHIIRLKSIHHLVKHQGLTLNGAKEALNQPDEKVDRDTVLRERLTSVREYLLKLREAL